MGGIRLHTYRSKTYVPASIKQGIHTHVQGLAGDDNKNRRLHRKQLAGILVALREYPVRIGCVKHAILSPDTPYPPFLDLLELLAPHLRSLRFLPCPQNGLDEGQVSRQLFNSMISDNMSFTLLRHLELNIAKPVRLAKLLERLPALAHLTLTFRGVGEGRTTDHTNEGTTTTAHQSIANLVLKIPPILSGVDITAIRDTFGTIASFSRISTGS